MHVMDGEFLSFGRPGALLVVWTACAWMAALTGAAASAQTGNPSSADDPYYGSVTAQPVTDETLRLSLDDAVHRGLLNNLGLRESEDNELTLKGEKNQALQQFLPTLTFSADTGFHQVDLVALGFNSSLIGKFAFLFPGGKIPPGISLIKKYDLTDAYFHLDWTLISSPVIAGWKAAGAATRAAYFAKMSARGQVVQDVATVYLRAIADQSEVENADAQVAEAQVLFDHAHLAHLAGTEANLDELRARVELQAEEQAAIAARNQRDKDLILLKREIGIDPAQKIELADKAPFSELATQTPEEVMAIAYKDRQDYQNLQNQLVEFKAAHNVYRSQRLPTLKFSSYYGTSSVDGAGTRGNFTAMGTLSVPLFREARLRGDEDASLAQLRAVNAQLDDLRTHIDQQVRSSLLDVEADAKLVDVARSNVDLATRALSDETDRVNAGVDDNLPLVTAQAALAAAQTNLVETTYQYNVSKILLARSCGVLEQQYRIYLGEQ
jgi:outer membrane protein TolC